MSNTASLKKEYAERIAPALKSQFQYSSTMQIPVLKKIVINQEIIFPEINIDSITRILGMNITFVTSAETDEEGYALLKEFGLPFKNAKKD